MSENSIIVRAFVGPPFLSGQLRCERPWTAAICPVSEPSFSGKLGALSQSHKACAPWKGDWPNCCGEKGGCKDSMGVLPLALAVPTFAMRRKGD